MIGLFVNRDVRTHDEPSKTPLSLRPSVIPTMPGKEKYATFSPAKPLCDEHGISYYMQS